MEVDLASMIAWRLGWSRVCFHPLCTRGALLSAALRVWNSIFPLWGKLKKHGIGDAPPPPHQGGEGGGGGDLER